MTEQGTGQKKAESTRDGDLQLCPFLGFMDDPETAISYASKMNCCNHARPIAPVALEYQREICLTRKFTGCPVYQREKSGPLPASMQENRGFRSGLRPFFPFIILVIVLLAGLVAALMMGLFHIPVINATRTEHPASPSGEVSPLSPTPMVTSTIQVTPSEPVVPTPSETVTVPTSIEPHLIETLIGDSPSLIIHKVLEGEGYIWLAQNYNTTEDAIKAINFNLPNSLWVNTILVIPVNTSDIANLPKFSTYMIETERMTIEEMATLLQLDVELLKKYNDLPAGYEFVPGEWLLIPH